MKSIEKFRITLKDTKETKLSPYASKLSEDLEKNVKIALRKLYNIDEKYIEAKISKFKSNLAKDYIILNVTTNKAKSKGKKSILNSEKSIEAIKLAVGDYGDVEDITKKPNGEKVGSSKPQVQNGSLEIQRFKITPTNYLIETMENENKKAQNEKRVPDPDYDIEDSEFNDSEAEVEITCSDPEGSETYNQTFKIDKSTADKYKDPKTKKEALEEIHREVYIHARCLYGNCRFKVLNVYDSKFKDVYPNKGETKEDFISRFMKETKEEYPDYKQRLAVAYSYWNKSKGVKK